MPFKRLRDGLVSRQSRILLRALVRLIRKVDGVPGDQCIRYTPIGGRTKYTFGLWVFPEETHTNVLKDYRDFALDYYRRTGFRPDLPHTGDRVAQDQSSLLSYTFDGGVMSVDPVCTPREGREEFIVAYNEFSSLHGGFPLFNQASLLARHQVRRAYGDRIDRFMAFRKRFDPGERLLSPYFRELLV